VLFSREATAVSSMDEDSRGRNSYKLIKWSGQPSLQRSAAA
jgi:hypothetical protein